MCVKLYTMCRQRSQALDLSWLAPLPCRVYRRHPGALIRRSGNAQQLARVSAQDRFLVGVAQERRVEDEIDTDGPVEGIVGSVHHLASADLGDEMSQPLLTKHHRVDQELASEIFTGLLLERLTVGAARTPAQGVRSAGVRGQVPASMCRADLEARETIERALENQM